MAKKERKLLAINILILIIIGFLNILWNPATIEGRTIKIIIDVICIVEWLWYLYVTLKINKEEKNKS